MSEAEILELKIAQLEAENRSLRQELDQIYTSNLTCELSTDFISVLSRNLIENIQTGIIVHAANTKIIYSNPAGAKFLDFIQSELVGKDIQDPDWQFYYGDGRLMSLEDFPINKILQTKQVLKDYEVGVYRSDKNDVVWGLINAYPELNEQNEIIRVVVTFVDISDRKKIEIDLRDSKQLYAALAAAAPVGIFRTDANGQCIYVNQKWIEISGVDYVEAMGNGWTNGLHFEDRQKIFAEWQNSINENRPFYLEYRFKKSNHKEIWVIGQSVAEKNVNGEITGFIGTITDINDLKLIELELEETYSFLQTIIDHLPVAVFVKDAKAKDFGKMLLWNRASEEMFGILKADAIGATVYDHFPKEQSDFFYQKDKEVFLKGVSEDIPEEPIDSHSLGRRILHTVKIPLYDRDHQPQYLLCFSEDITERKMVENALRESEERFRQMAENIHEIFWMTDVDFSRFIYVNPAYEKILGFSCETLYKNSQSFFDNIHEEDRKKVIAISQQNRRTGWKIEYRIVQPNGEVKWLFESTVPVRDSSGKIKSIVGIGQDITDRKSSEEKLIYQAFHDSLTGLPNRTLFADRLEMVLKKSKRMKDHHFAILFIDLDRFKVINDSLGHLIGDHLLIEMAKILEKSVRSFDTVARLGGDEFIILLDDIDNSYEVIEVAERIHTHLQSEIVIDGNQILTSASIGIVFGSNNYENANDLLRDADIAMYQAKSQGRACYEIFDQTMYDLVLSRLQLENELRQAIAREEFLVYYEPIICLKTMSLSGFEALVRWQHPTRGLISAGEFVPICEETGMIVPLGKWVLQTACHQVKSWLEKYSIANLTINVNLSGKQLRSPHIIETIDEVLSETGMPPSCLNLEITETILIENTEIATIVFQKLQERGVQLSLDDFGTGFSSLSYLQRFPVNIIKIDRFFISQIHSGDRNIEIVKAIIALAHVMNIKVIAEGIEIGEQITQLQAWDCDFAQGYYFARSLNAEDAAKLLEKSSQA